MQNVTLDDYLGFICNINYNRYDYEPSANSNDIAVVAMLKPNSQMEKIFKDLGVKDVPKFIKENGKLSNSFDKIVSFRKKIGVTMGDCFLVEKEGLSAQLSLECYER